MTFVDPRGVPGAAALPYELQAPLEPGTVIGLMANGFPDSVAFLNHIAEALEPRLPGVEFARYDKGNASRLADEDMLADVAENCSAVIAAYGH